MKKIIPFVVMLFVLSSCGCSDCKDCDGKGKYDASYGEYLEGMECVYCGGDGCKSDDNN